MYNDFGNWYPPADLKVFAIVSSGCHFILGRFFAINTIGRRQNHSWGNKSAIADELTCPQNRN
jgi:hypothetical protein